MSSKLTLRLNEDLIRNAKKYAKNSGKSVSKIVADHFEFIRNAQGNTADADDSPATHSLRGVMRDFPVSEADYRQHIENKYL